MGISPDRGQAMQESAELIRLVRTILERVRPGCALPGDEDLTYPGFVGFAHAAQRYARTAKTGWELFDERARQVTDGARLSAGRARGCRCRAGRWI